MPQELGYYEALGVPPDATPEAIKKEYYKKARKVVPSDLSGHSSVAPAWPGERNSCQAMSTASRPGFSVR